MQSIQARLSASLIVILVSVFFLQWAMVSYALRHLTEEFLVTRLQHDAESLLAALSDVDNKMAVPAERVADVYHRPFSGHYYHIEIDDRDLHSRSLWDEDLPIQPVAVGETQIQFHNGPLQQPLLVYVAGFRKQGQNVIIGVAHDIKDYQEDVLQLQLAYGGVSLATLLLILRLQIRHLRRGLRPAEEARHQLRAMQKGEMNRLNEDVPVEIKPLVQEINHLVELHQQRLQRSRNALGNLAHAMKTPLSILMRHLDDNDLQAHPSLRADMLAQLQSMKALIERELKRARLASGGAESHRRFQVKEDVTALVAVMQQVYADKQLQFETGWGELQPCKLDREDMQEILGNLLDNASKWATSRVKITVSCGQYLQLRVEDDGPGVDEERLASLKQRGVRVDEAALGHGLGLAIVEDAVAHYNGDLQLARSPELGGFSVEVRIPQQ